MFAVTHSDCGVRWVSSLLPYIRTKLADLAEPRWSLLMDCSLFFIIIFFTSRYIQSLEPNNIPENYEKYPTYISSLYTHLLHFVYSVNPHYCFFFCKIFCSYWLCANLTIHNYLRKWLSSLLGFIIFVFRNIYTEKYNDVFSVVAHCWFWNLCQHGFAFFCYFEILANVRIFLTFRSLFVTLAPSFHF